MSRLLQTAGIIAASIAFNSAPALAQQARDPVQDSVHINWSALDQLGGNAPRPAATYSAPESFSQSAAIAPSSPAQPSPREAPAARPLPMPAPVATTGLQPASPVPAEPAPQIAALSEPAAAAVSTPAAEPVAEPVTAAVATPADNDLLIQLAFPGQSEALTNTAMQQLTQLAERMNSLAGRLQVRSYAAATDSSSSSARKLSFKRALAVRSFLIEQGIRSTRVDLRALGPAEDGGLQDRVDILLTTG